MKRLLLLLLPALLGGCSESVEPEPLTYLRLLAGEESKSWRLSTITLLEPGRPPDIFTINCLSDDIYTFRNDAQRSFRYQEGNTACFSNDLSFDDTYAFTNANATLRFFFLPVFLLGADAPSDNYIVKRLEERTMVIEYYDTQDQYSFQFTFAAVR